MLMNPGVVLNPSPCSTSEADPLLPGLPGSEVREEVRSTAQELRPGTRRCCHLQAPAGPALCSAPAGPGPLPCALPCRGPEGQQVRVLGSGSPGSLGQPGEAEEIGQ